MALLQRYMQGSRHRIGKILYLFKDILVFKWLVPLQFVHQAFPNEHNYIISRPTKWKLHYSAYVFHLEKDGT